MDKLTIHCNSVEEYFRLPRNQREYWGLYKVPFALPAEGLDLNKYVKEKGWTTFYSTIQNHYPIQYFLRHWLWSYDNPVYKFCNIYIKWPIRDFKWSLKLLFKPCHPRWRKVLPRYKYSDITELVVKSNFALILDFYYEEVVNGWVDWKSDEAHKTFYDELISNVKWIEDGGPKLEKAIQKALNKAHKHRCYKKDGKFDYDATYGKMNALEDEYKRKETQILQWFIENRQSFWT